MRLHSPLFPDLAFTLATGLHKDRLPREDRPMLFNANFCGHYPPVQP